MTSILHMKIYILLYSIIILGSFLSCQDTTNTIESDYLLLNKTIESIESRFYYVDKGAFELAPYNSGISIDIPNYIFSDKTNKNDDACIRTLKDQEPYHYPEEYWVHRIKSLDSSRWESELINTKFDKGLRLKTTKYKEQFEKEAKNPNNKYSEYEWKRYFWSEENSSSLFVKISRPVYFNDNESAFLVASSDIRSYFFYKKEKGYWKLVCNLPVAIY